MSMAGGWWLVRNAECCRRPGVLAAGLTAALPAPAANLLAAVTSPQAAATSPPGNTGHFLLATVYILLIFAGISVGVIVMNWVERKVLAHMQVRLGPMRVGPHGLLQPIADALKLLLKEDLVPQGADHLVFWLAPVVVVVAAFSAFTAIPFGPTAAVSDLNIGVLFVLAVASLGVLGIIFAGWSSNSHYPLLGALRAGAQMVSYEITIGLAVVAVLLHTGTLSMQGIVRAQIDHQQWLLFREPVAFGLFAVAMVAETNRSPFDLPEAESELVAGYHAEYSGFRWSLFMLGEYAGMMLVSAVAVTLWLGGWTRPFPNVHAAGLDALFSFVPAACFLLLAGMALRAAWKMPGHRRWRVQRDGLAVFGSLLLGLGLLLAVPPMRTACQNVFWFVLKVAVFQYLFIWYRATFPRYRYDQLLRIGWRILIPTALANLVLSATLTALRP